LNILARITLLIVIVIIPSLLCLAQGGKRTFEPAPPPVQAPEYIQSRWTSVSKIPGLAITMPGEPAASTQQIDSPFGPLTQYLYLLTTETGSYMVSYFDLPAPLSDQNAIKNALAKGRDNMLAENRNMKLLKEQERKIAGHQGQELLVADGDMLVQQRGFIDGRRVYQVALAVPVKVAFKSGRASADSADFTDIYRMIVSRFLDSARTNNFGYGPGIKIDEELKRVARGGVLNGKAISLPKPSYPREARDAGASGTVTVQVLIDEVGAVIWAKAVSGHPLLQETARKAALKARFAPFTLQGRPAKVSGVLTYNFAP
jgi:TonB family protein